MHLTCLSCCLYLLKGAVAVSVFCRATLVFHAWQSMWSASMPFASVYCLSLLLLTPRLLSMWHLYRYAL